MKENSHTQQPVNDNTETEKQENALKEQQPSVSDETTEQPETASKEQQLSASDETTEQPETASKEQQPSVSDDTTEQPETASKEQQHSASEDADMSELEKQRQQLQQDRLKFEYEKKLFKRNLPKEIADYLDLSSPEKCEESYEKFMKLIPKIMDECLKGDMPLKKAPYEQKQNIDTAIKSAFDY